MPTTINGYHVFQIPNAIKESSEAISFNDLRNDLGDGYFSRALYGSASGNRKFKLSLPTLTGGDISTRTATGPNDEVLSYEQYIWALFCETKVTGQPFVYQSARNSQYYLVDFLDDELSYDRMLVKLYSGTLQLHQVRKLNTWVFQNTEIENLLAGYDETSWFGGFGAGWTNVIGSIGDSHHLTSSGNVAATGTQNSLTTTQFNVGATNDGFLLTSGSATFKELWVVMKMREASFSNFAGIVSGPGAGEIVMTGDNGTTKFFDNYTGLTTFTYEKNAVSYPSTNMQAPMNTWGVVRMRSTVPWVVTQLQVGKDRNFAGRFAEVDIGEIIISSECLPKHDVREMWEYLMTKWAIS